MTNSRDSQRWRQAKNKKRGVQAAIELYVPIPRNKRQKPQQAKAEIIENLKPNIDKLRQKVRGLDGILHVYQHT